MAIGAKPFLTTPLPLLLLYHLPLGYKIDLAKS